MKGQRVFVESSCISAFAFFADESVLKLEFRNGLAYEYFGVPAPLYSELLTAESKGAFVARFIRGRFSFRRLEPSGDLTQ